MKVISVLSCDSLQNIPSSVWSKSTSSPMIPLSTEAKCWTCRCWTWSWGKKDLFSGNAPVIKDTSLPHTDRRFTILTIKDSSSFTRDEIIHSNKRLAFLFFFFFLLGEVGTTNSHHLTIRKCFRTWLKEDSHYQAVISV